MTRAELDRILASGDPALIAATCRTLFVALLEAEEEVAVLHQAYHGIRRDDPNPDLG